jgi:dipeptidyl-peptidase-4
VTRPTPGLATLLACALAGAAACTMTTPRTPTTTWPIADEDFVARFAATYGFRLGTPQEVTIAPDGDVLFTRTEPRGFVADLFVRSAATGEVRRVLDAETLLGGGEEALSAEEKARRERMRKATRGIAGYQLSADGRRLLVPLSDRLFVVPRDGAPATALDTGDGFPYDPRLSPDGTRVAYVRDGDLWVAALAGGPPRRLTTRPGPEIEHAVAEFVAQEEMGRTRGHWWSPDGTVLAYQRSDLSRVDTLWVGDPAHPERAPTPFRYPRAGAADAEVTLGLIPATGGATTWVAWDRARWPYLCRVTWTDGAPLTLLVMNRAQTELAVLAVDAASGATGVLHTETDAAWLNLPSPALPAWLPGGAGWLWASEREGAWQLERRAADGTLAEVLVGPEAGLQEVAGLDPRSGLAWFEASTDPTQTQVWTVPATGGAPRAVTDAPGVHAVTVGPAGGAVVASSPQAGGHRVWVHAPDGTPVAELPSVAEPPPWQAQVQWTTAAVDGRVHHAAIIRPRAFVPGRRYPVLLHVYGGPGHRMVAATPRAFTLDQWYADAGFVVVAVDGRGTPNRGRAWERAIHRDLATIPLDDQVDALRALAAAHPELDLERVGVYGWSFGGYLSGLAALRRPDVFRAAVAGAPVTDWGLYDTFYTERYMDLPSENPEGYRATSLVQGAAALTRPLLVIHGTTDDNVHVAHSLQLAAALFAAGRRVELLPVSATHMTPDPALALALHRRQLAFFREHLAAP